MFRDSVVRIVGFWGRRKTGEPGEKPSEQGREPTTNSTHIWVEVFVYLRAFGDYFHGVGWVLLGLRMLLLQDDNQSILPSSRFSDFPSNPIGWDYKTSTLRMHKKSGRARGRVFTADRKDRGPGRK